MRFTPSHKSKWEVEKHIRSLGLPATMLRPAAFMENYYIDQVEIGILKGKLMDPIRADDQPEFLYHGE